MILGWSLPPDHRGVWYDYKRHLEAAIAGTSTSTRTLARSLYLDRSEVVVQLFDCKSGKRPNMKGMAIKHQFKLCG